MIGNHSLYRNCYKSYNDFCYLFLEEYASPDRIKDKKKALKNKRISSNNGGNYENQVYVLIAQFRNIDELIIDKELV